MRLSSGDHAGRASARTRHRKWLRSGLAAVLSMATLAAVLSEDNRALLRLIRQAKPKTMTELAALSGRQVPNLSRTLRMMEGYGLVALTKNARQTRPTALATEFLVVLD